MKQHRIDHQRIFPAGAASTIRLRGLHNPAQDEPYFSTGQGRRGGRPRVPARPAVQPQGRTTTANHTQHERTENNAATSPCRREPVDRRRCSGTNRQDLSLRRRELIRGIHLREDTRRASLGAGAECGYKSRSELATDSRRQTYVAVAHPASYEESPLLLYGPPRLGPALLPRTGVHSAAFAGRCSAKLPRRLVASGTDRYAKYRTKSCCD